MGILIASFGFILHICKHIRMMGCRFKSGLTEASLIMEIHASLTFREIEYLEHIKVRNLPVYGEVLRKLLNTDQIYYLETSKVLNTSDSSIFNHKMKILYIMCLYNICISIRNIVLNIDKKYEVWKIKSRLDIAS